MGRGTTTGTVLPSVPVKMEVVAVGRGTTTGTVLPPVPVKTVVVAVGRGAMTPSVPVSVGSKSVSVGRISESDGRMPVFVGAVFVPVGGRRPVGKDGEGAVWLSPAVGWVAPVELSWDWVFVGTGRVAVGSVAVGTLAESDGFDAVGLAWSELSVGEGMTMMGVSVLPPVGAG